MTHLKWSTSYESQKTELNACFNAQELRIKKLEADVKDLTEIAKKHHELLDRMKIAKHFNAPFQRRIQHIAMDDRINDKDENYQNQNAGDGTAPLHQPIYHPPGERWSSFCPIIFLVG